MLKVKFETQAQWLAGRLKKITGTRLKEIVVKKGTGKKIGFYELIAENLAVDDSEFEGYVPNETPMDRGTRLQKYAVDQFRKTTGKDVDESLVLWTREDNPNIAYSPDGVVIGSDDTETVETKCLSSARHVEAYLTNTIPDDYEFQKLQSFIVNEKQQKLYFCFYDPRLPSIAFFYIVVTREEVKAEIEQYLEYQRKTLAEVDEIVAKLSGF